MWATRRAHMSINTQVHKHTRTRCAQAADACADVRYARASAGFFLK
jgi:hypothetical protein